MNKAKVCFYIETTGFAGCENHLVQLIENLEPQEFEITVILHATFEPEQALDIFRTRLRSLSDAGRIAQLHEVSTRYLGLKALLSLTAIKHIWNQLAAQAGIVHVYKASIGRCTLVMILARLQRRYCIQTIQLPPNRSARFRFTPREIRHNLYLRLSNLIITVDEAFRKRCIDFYRIPAERVIAIHNGIRINQFRGIQTSRESKRLQLSSNLGIDIGGRTIFLTAARFDPSKGLKFLLEAILLISVRNPDLYRHLLFLFAGSGELEDEYRGYVDCCKLSDGVRFLGFRSDIAELLVASDCFILPSLHEGLPLSIVEAMVMRKPVIASRIDGVTEVVLDGKTGILVNPEDVESLADAIINFVSLPEARKNEMGEKGERRAESYFDHSKQTARLRDIYHKTTDSLFR